MSEINVVVIEDEDGKREIIRFWLDRYNYVISREAATLAEAQTAVVDMASGELDCDVIILDGSLSKNRSVDESQIIMGDIRAHGLGVKVIGFSAGEPLSERGLDVDADVNKENFSKLPEVIGRLTDPS